jgi:hypothetical protein
MLSIINPNKKSLYYNMEETYIQKYYKDNKDLYNDYKKAYYQDNKEKILEYQNNYNKTVRKNKGKLAAKRETVKKNLKKNAKKVEEFRNLLLNNKNT